MAIRRKRIRLLANNLLEQNGITAPPVPIEQIVASRGLLIGKSRNEKSRISGILAHEKERFIIGVNAAHSMARQRFTIAHELGHFLLHFRATDEIYIDRSFEVKFRDDLASQDTDEEEREANLFAAELLMPRQFLKRDLLNTNEIDLIDGKFLEEIAVRYQVSSQAMHFRLISLGYINL